MNKVIKEERLIRIIDFLKEKNTAKLAELSELNNVSLDTTRRDLKELAEMKMLNLVRGGAVFLNEFLPDGQIITNKSIAHEDEKKEIVQLVGYLISDGQAIALNSGTTNTEVAKYLVNNYINLTILTNSLHVINIMERAKNFTVIIPGGIVDTEEGAIYGEYCERDILKYNIDLAILDINFISIDKGITESSVKKSGILSAMIQASNKRAVIAEYDKFNKQSFINVSDLSNIDYILSDSKLPKGTSKYYEEKHIQMINPK